MAIRSIAPNALLGVPMLDSCASKDEAERPLSKHTAVKLNAESH
jgi:hypothetical protein